MDWYYAIKGEQKGPVADADFQQLVQRGVIKSDTLIWRQGLSGWMAYSASTAMPLEAPPGSVICAACRRVVPEADAFTLSGARYCAVCKPQILQRIAEGKPIASSAAEEMRKKYISHETSIKSLGLLYGLGGSILTIAALVGGVGIISGGAKPETIGVMAFLLVFGVIELTLAVGVRRLRPWARIPAVIVSCIGLLGFPVGTIISGYFLYLLASQKGATVFSREYQAVIQQTPHIKFRTPASVWIVIIVLVLAIVGGITAAVLYNKH